MTKAHLAYNIRRGGKVRYQVGRGNLLKWPNIGTHIIQLHGLLHQFVLDRVAGAGVGQAVVLHGVLLRIALGHLQLYLSGHCG